MDFCLVQGREGGTLKDMYVLLLSDNGDHLNIGPSCNNFLNKIFITTKPDISVL